MEAFSSQHCILTSVLVSACYIMDSKDRTPSFYIEPDFHRSGVSDMLYALHLKNAVLHCLSVGTKRKYSKQMNIEPTIL